MFSQVFTTYSNEDYDRRNDEVDPMAASAEYELEKRVERLDLFPVELEKGTRPADGVFLTEPCVFLEPVWYIVFRVINFLFLNKLTEAACFAL